MGITIQLPDHLDLSEFEVKMALATKLFERGTISSGQGAELVGVSKRSFIRLLSEHGVSIFQYNFDEVLEDVKSASERGY